MRLNLFYPAVALVGVGLFFLLQSPATTLLSFFGFAESSETTVNYNYPVVIDRILVSPGEAVSAGQPLMEVSRRKSRDILADQQFRIDELRAEERLWSQRKRDAIDDERRQMTTKAAEVSAELTAAREELAFRASQLEGLKTIEATGADYRPLENKISRLENELATIEADGEAVSSQLERELRLGANPYREQVRRLEAEMRFDEDQQVIPFTVSAPADGLIGNIRVREREHVPSYETLLTFYEPHSSIVRGYVHEDLTAAVRVGDSLEVYSLKVPDLRYLGVVTGLGGRIVETPERLRKLPDFKTYGREVVLQITRDNNFLQKEKVGVREYGTE